MPNITTNTKLNKCKCNFIPPHPLRQDNHNGVLVGTDYYPEEFFCSFCKGVIVNDLEYIGEVIRYYSYQRWGTMYDNPHKNKIRELELGDKIFGDKYKKLLNLIK